MRFCQLQRVHTLKCLAKAYFKELSFEPKHSLGSHYLSNNLLEIIDILNTVYRFEQISWRESIFTFIFMSI
jgi:hypothetical protein